MAHKVLFVFLFKPFTLVFDRETPTILIRGHTCRPMQLCDHMDINKWMRESWVTENLKMQGLAGSKVKE